MLTTCLKEYWSNVIAITMNEPFDDGNAYPLPFNWTLLAQKYDTHSPRSHQHHGNSDPICNRLRGIHGLVDKFSSRMG